MNPRIKLPTIILLVFVIFSCDTNDITEDTQGIENNTFPEESQSKTSRSPIVLEDDWHSIERFQNRMQWVSYITAQVLLKSADARTLFQNELNNSVSTNVVKLENLLGDDVTDLSFYQEFADEFLLNYHGVEICDGIGRPRNRPAPSETSTTGGVLPGADYDTYLVDAYVASLLNMDCLEFYLPHGFAFLHTTGSGLTLTSHIRSTAHPLTHGARSNKGFNHVNACIVSEIEVDDNTNGFVLVVRPYRNTNCLYDSYYVNFEDFLN